MMNLRSLRKGMSFPVALTLALVLVLFAGSGPAAARDGYYRYPTLRGNTVVFTAEGDLWRVGAGGGRAERITTHPDEESRAALSPDGRSVAFVGNYERVAEVYVMPLDGGVPRRLSWQGQNPQVWGWTPAGEVLYSAPSTRGEPVSQLYAVDPRTLARRTLPVGQAGDGALGPDGATLFFTREGLGGDNVRAYRGGLMASLWRIDLAGSAEAVPLLPAALADANNRRPMPYTTPQGLRVAFVSDRAGSYNLYSVDARGGDLRQHTQHSGFDIRQAAIDGTRVVYTLGADVWIADLADAVGAAPRQLAIALGGDADTQRTRWVQRPQAFFGGASPSPDGQRVVLNVRGRVATQGIAPLRRAELAVPDDARCQGAVYAPDGATIYALCDIAAAAGSTPATALADKPPEMEIWRFKADGSGTPMAITRGATVRRTAIFPSPDGRWLLHTDLAGHMTLTAVGNATQAPAARESRDIEPPQDYGLRPVVAWAPDSRSFVFARPDFDGLRKRLFIYELASKRVLPLTSPRYDSDAPAYTPDGRWLYFLSDRSFVSSNASPWGDRNMGPFFDRRTKIYALALQAGSRFPFQPRDELDPTPPPPQLVPALVPAPAPIPSAASGPTPAVPAPITTAAPGPAAAPIPVPGTPASGAGRGGAAAVAAVQTQGLAGRLYEVPLAAGNYSELATDGRRLYVLEGDGGSENRRTLKTLTIDNSGAPAEIFAPDVARFELSGDARRLMLQRRPPPGVQAGDIQLFDAAPKAPAEPAQLARAQVPWTDWQINTEPAAEWRQLFNDAWRLHRDHFYDARMHGVDWPAARVKYGALLPRVGDRQELNDLLGQMTSEVAALHSQVFSPDLRRGADDVAAAGLGARFTRVADGFRVEHVYRSDPELPNELAPLAHARVFDGETVTHVNGRALAAAAEVPDIQQLIRGQVGRQVLLDVKGADGRARRVIVVPVNAMRETQLRAGDWERGNAEHAAARSEGRVGYLRLRAMVGADIASFAREFYAQIDREAMVIDVRSNNGGSIDSWIIEKLLRRTWAWWQQRWPEKSPPFSNMQQTFRGPIAVLIDGNTYSDGETFAAGMQRLGLGTLVGRRTAGAGVWLSDSNRLLDGGLARAAELGQFTADGQWLIEGRGVRPDIEVDNLPRATFLGGDAQLDTAVDLLRRKLVEQPVRTPVAPPLVPPAQRPR